jgi:glucose-1-phosphate adenylyltransferase
VKIGKNSKIIDSIIMADTEIGDNVTIRKAIIANDVKVADNVVIGDGKEIAVVGEKKVIDK